jgi:hypothetical protein
LEPLSLDPATITGSPVGRSEKRQYGIYYYLQWF